MATNCPQQVKPRAWRSALCLSTNCSNSRRENIWSICENMLHTGRKAEPPPLRIVVRENHNLNLAEIPPLLFQMLIWTSLGKPSPYETRLVVVSPPYSSFLRWM